MFLDIVLLRTFVAVVEAKGFTRAAGFVNLTQSAVSLHIKRLEEQVGRRLFDRAAPKLALTSDGEILLSYARRILALEEEVKTRLGHPEPEGIVRFGAPEYFDPGTLASLLAQFNSRYPAIELEINRASGPTSPLNTDAACSTSQSSTARSTKRTGPTATTTGQAKTSECCIVKAGSGRRCRI
jgi:DNA-binding transcriptional LysR family regulator